VNDQSDNRGWRAGAGLDPAPYDLELDSESVEAVFDRVDEISAQETWLAAVLETVEGASEWRG
jgi:hypothetical protein